MTFDEWIKSDQTLDAVFFEEPYYSNIEKAFNAGKTEGEIINPIKTENPAFDEFFNKDKVLLKALQGLSLPIGELLRYAFEAGQKDVETNRASFLAFIQRQSTLRRKEEYKQKGDCVDQIISYLPKERSDLAAWLECARDFAEDNDYLAEQVEKLSKKRGEE